MIKFLGSFRFALILISLSALGVIAGTFLESKHESHGVAEDWIYHHPLFQALLGGYFINILLSALSRRPFKKKHIPFLITHLGLLMIISGVFIKSVWGTQGHLQLIVGTASDELVLPNRPALWVKQRGSGKTISIPEKQLKITEYYPHAEEKLVGWLKKGVAHISGFPPLPKREEPYPLDIGEKEPLNVYVDSTTIPESPYLLIQDKKGVVVLSTEDISLSFDPKNLESYVAYDHGFGGYTLQAEIPFGNKKKALAEELNHHLQSGKPFSPPLELIAHSMKNSPLDFGKTVIDYLKKWDEEKSWLSDIPLPLNWEGVPFTVQNALFWIAELHEEEHFLEHLRQNKWPLIDALEKEGNQPAQYKLWMEQMWALQHDLPKMPFPTAKMLSAYLRLYDIHWSNIAFVPEKTITLETPLFRILEKKEPPAKKEEAEPLAFIEFDGEVVPLIYDTKGTRLKTRSKNGNFLLNYQPHRIKLPYFVRLHQAEEIKYPESNQTASYECTLSLIQKSTGQITPCSLQMNHVFETDDGYRFYLAGMGTIDPYGVRSVQLVVNRDPAKWFLTYPGAGFLALGIILLFWRRKFGY